MNLIAAHTETYTCPLTGEVLRNGDKRGKLLGVDSVRFHCNAGFWSGGHLILEVHGKGTIYFDIAPRENWSWDLVARIREKGWQLKQEK